MVLSEGKRFSSVRFARKIALFAYGYFLLYLFRDDMIKHYLHERYQPLTVGAAALLITASIAYSSVERRSCGCDDNHGHSHSKPRGTESLAARAAAALSFVFILIPVILGFAAPATVLGSASGMMKNKGVFSATSSMVASDALRNPHPSDIKMEISSAGGEKPATVSYSPINLMELHMLLSGGGDAFVGDRVAIQGFVYESAKSEEGFFSLVRYVIPCCIVHAVAVSMDVSVGSAAPPANDQWARVYGVTRKFAEPRGDGPENIYYIEAEKIETEETPSDPYINRSYLRKPFMF